MTDTVFTLDYELLNCERQFDVAQGIAANRRRLKKRNIKCRSGTRMLRRLYICAGYFGILAVLSFVLAILLVDDGIQCLAVICGFCGIFELLLALSYRRSYSNAWKQFHERSGHTGRIIFDEVGIQMCRDNGTEMKVLWSDYDGCFITDEVIVLPLKIPMMFLLPYTPESVLTVRYALEHYGYGDTIYEREIRK